MFFRDREIYVVTVGYKVLFSLVLGRRAKFFQLYIKKGLVKALKLILLISSIDQQYSVYSGIRIPVTRNFNFCELQGLVNLEGSPGPIEPPSSSRLYSLDGHLS